jgi:hypothetical protein
LWVRTFIGVIGLSQEKRGARKMQTLEVPLRFSQKSLTGGSNDEKGGIQDYLAKALHLTAISLSLFASS